jgi:branched-chain amino acid transport system substrate-binding protein
MTADLFEQAGYTSDGGYIVSYLNQDSKSTSYLNFKNKYRGLYGKDPTFASNLTYEAVNVLKEGLVHSDTENPESIKEAILDIQQFQGLQGQLNINRYGDIMRDIYLYEIRDNAFQLIEE